ncbi:MAG: NHL repeat-containing protein [Hyphomicrobiaceae bacterium]
MRTFLATLVTTLLLTNSASSLEAAFERASTAKLANPHDIDLSGDGKLLYVADVGNNRIAVLDPNTLKEIGQFAKGRLKGPHDVDLGSDGRLYVADTHNHRVAIFAPEGTSARHIGDLKGKFRAPEGAARLADGTVIAPGAWSGNVLRFRDGKVMARAGGLSSPHDVEPAGDGNIWLADSANNRILKMTPEFKILQELKGAPYKFNGVRYLAVEPDGTLWAADKYTHRLLAIDPATGELLLTLGTGSPGKGKNVFRTPEGVVVRGNTLWISDSGNNRIVRYRITR